MKEDNKLNGIEASENMVLLDCVVAFRRILGLNGMLNKFVYFSIYLLKIFLRSFIPFKYLVSFEIIYHNHNSFSHPVSSLKPNSNRLHNL